MMNIFIYLLNLELALCVDKVLLVCVLVPFADIIQIMLCPSIQGSEDGSDRLT